MVEEDAAPWPQFSQSMAVAILVTVTVTLISRFGPSEHAGTGVGFVFMLATWWCVLRGNTTTIRAYGLSLGGLVERLPIDPKRMLRDGSVALGWALMFCAFTFPAFWIGYKYWFSVRAPLLFTWPPDFLSQVVTMLVATALPEEFFFRGYLQSALDGYWSNKRLSVLGVQLGPGWIVASLLFAVGHFLTIPYAGRLAVFFPSLAFGWLRAKTGGVGAPILFHAFCNLFSLCLQHAYGL